MEIIEKNIDFNSKKDKEFTVIPLGDVHLGNKGCDEERLYNAIQYIKNKERCYWIGMGDYIDAINYLDPRFDSRQVNSRYILQADGKVCLEDMVERQVSDFLRMVEPIKDKCIGLICLSNDTLVLSKDGWKNYSEVSIGDEVLSLNTEKNVFEYKKIIDTYKFKYSGDMVNLNSKVQNQLVTPDHNVLRKRRTDYTLKECKSYNRNSDYWDNVGKEYKYNKASELPVKSIIPISSKYNGSMYINPDMVRVIGWIITEGSFLKGKSGNGIYIYQAKKKNIKKITQCLDNLGFSYNVEKKEYTNRRTNEKPWVAIYIRAKDAKKIRKIIETKDLTREILNNWDFNSLSILRDTMLLGDGCECKGHWVFYTGDKNLAHNFLELCLKTDQSATLHQRIRKQKFKGYDYYVTTTEYSVSLLQSKSQAVKKKLIHYDGEIFDLTVQDNHNFVAMRDGKPFITGNCGNHEETVRKYHHWDITQHLAYELKVPYLGFCAFIRLNFKRHTGDSKAVTQYIIYATHGFGGSRKSGAKINRIEDLCHFFESDIVLIGHEHKKIYTTVTRLSISHIKTPRLVHRKTVGVMTGCFLRGYIDNGQNYVERAGYSPTDLGVVKLYLNGVEKDVHVSL